MRILTFILIFSSLQLKAQHIRPKLTILDCYKYAISEFLKEHPEMVVQSNKEKFLLIQQQPFLSDYLDTNTHVNIKLIEVDSIQNYQAILTKEKVFYILDLQPLMLRELNAFAWIMPKRVAIKKKNKNRVFQTSYTNLLCEYQFDYTPDRVQFYLFKGKTCKQNQ